MSKYRKLTHVYYKCDYHIVFTPKYRFKILDRIVKSLVEHDIQVINTWKDVQIQEMNIQKRPYPFSLFSTTKSFHIKIYGDFEKGN